MANEIRLRVNNVSGAINDNPLLSGATTINSPNFVDLPVVNTTNHLILILDPLELSGPAEIVRVTAHGAGATDLTVARGQGGSTARQHSIGTTWFHGPVSSDWPSTVTNATRPTVPYTGQIIYESDTNISYMYTGTAWREISGPRYAALLYRSTDLAVAGGFTATAVPMNTLAWADDNVVFQGGADYTAPVDGLYHVTLNIQLDTGILSAPAIGFGPAALEGGRMTNSNANRAAGHNMVGIGSVNAGQKITGSIWNDGDVATDIRQGGTFTWMSVYRIGPRHDSPAAD